MNIVRSFDGFIARDEVDFPTALSVTGKSFVKGGAPLTLPHGPAIKSRYDQNRFFFT